MPTNCCPDLEEVTSSDSHYDSEELSQSDEVWQPVSSSGDSLLPEITPELHELANREINFVSYANIMTESSRNMQRNMIPQESERRDDSERPVVSSSDIICDSQDVRMDDSDFPIVVISNDIGDVSHEELYVPLPSPAHSSIDLNESTSSERGFFGDVDSSTDNEHHLMTWRINLRDAMTNHETNYSGYDVNTSNDSDSEYEDMDDAVDSTSSI